MDQHTPASLMACAARRGTCALAITAFVFFDVVFFGASLVSSHYDPHVTGRPPGIVNTLPERAGRAPYHGAMDIGASAFQMDPYRAFMAHAIRSGETPYWSPYTAAGSVVPDNLTSQAFAVPTVVSAILGGSDFSWHVCMLALIWLSTWCVLVICRDKLRLAPLAAVGAGLAFLLNGFVTSGPASLVVLPYYFAPPLLLALMRFIDAPTMRRAALAVLALAALLTTTFMPTLVLSAATSFVLALFYARARSRPVVKAGVALLAIGACGAGLDAFLLLPAIDTLRSSGDVGYYNLRPFQHVDWRALISLLSPKHFWESYSAISLPAPLGARDHELNLYCHTGVAAALVATLAFTLTAVRDYALAGGLVIVAAVLLWRVLGLPGAETITSALPFVRFFSIQYWPAALSLCTVFCVAYGLERIANGARPALVTYCLVFVAAANVVFLAAHFRMTVPAQNWIYVGLLVTLLAAVPALLAFNNPARGRFIGLVIVALIAAEGTFYVNHLKLRRYENAENLPGFVSWLRERTSPGGDRVFSATQRGLFPDWGAALRIPDIATMSLLGKSEHYARFFNRYLWTDFGGVLTWGMTNTGSASPDAIKALSLLGVRYIIVSEPGPKQDWMRRTLPAVHEEGAVTILENAGAVPRARLVTRVARGDGFAADPAIATMTADETLLAAAANAGVTPVDDPGTATIETYQNGYVKIVADVRASALLVLTDAWHRRWSAQADGHSAYIGRTDIAFRAISLRPGRHVVEFRYASPLITWAQIVSAIMILLVVLVFAAAPRSRVRARRPR